MASRTDTSEPKCTDDAVKVMTGRSGKSAHETKKTVADRHDDRYSNVPRELPTPHRLFMDLGDDGLCCEFPWTT